MNLEDRICLSLLLTTMILMVIRYPVIRNPEMLIAICIDIWTILFLSFGKFKLKIGESSL